MGGTIIEFIILHELKLKFQGESTFMSLNFVS